jgi:hypothetical protein
MSDVEQRLRDHVGKRGGARLKNSAWDLMIEAADRLHEQEAALRLAKTKAEEALAAIRAALAAEWWNGGGDQASG